jgi:YD repeat-containing protein
MPAGGADMWSVYELIIAAGVIVASRYFLAANSRGLVRKMIVLLGLVPLLNFIQPALGAASPGVTRFPALGTRPPEIMLPNGDFTVSVLVGGGWREAGKLSFDKFVREGKLDLAPLIPAGGPVRVRLVQRGGGAAHLDALLLGGKPPKEVNGKREEKIIRKLAKEDADLIDAFGKTFDLLFPAGTDRVLTVAARVEPEVIGATPFLIPSQNYCKDMNSDFSYYPYKLKQGKKGSGKEWRTKPFVSQNLNSGSGHPSAFLYSYVTNDQKNLYVDIDFTGDNTMDGDKDYTKVFVRTGAGVKEFKVSEMETKWGKPSFTYTDKVSYEHKLYKFRIPLREIGVSNVRQEEPLRLAFAAYGTCAPGDMSKSFPAIAHDSQNNRYLVVYRKFVDSCNYQVFGQIVTADGGPFSAEFLIGNGDSQTTPAVAYDPANQRFLVVWDDNISYMISGLLIKPDGTFFGSPFPIAYSAWQKWGPSIAYDGVNQRFLVAWTDFRNVVTTYADIYGQLVNADGTLFNTTVDFNFPITSVAFYQSAPKAAFDPVNQRFLVVWTDERNGFADIYGQLINADGTMLGGGFPIADAAGSHQLSPAVAYADTAQRFFAVWRDQRNGTDDIYGQLINADGTLTGFSPSDVNLPIATSVNSQETDPSVTYDSAAGNFLVTWLDGMTTSLTGQTLQMDGTPLSAPFAIAGTGGNGTHVVAYNSTCGNFMTAFTDYNGIPNDISLALIGSPCLALPSFTITASAGGGGYIYCYPTSVLSGSNSNCSIMPGQGYSVSDVTVDSASVGAVQAYNFINVTADHAIAASFVAIPPQVSYPTPADNSQDVNPVTLTISVEFNGPVNSATVNNGTFKVEDLNGNPVSGNVSYNSDFNVATFVPTAPLAGGTKYFARITTGVQNSGGSMLADYVWSFTTSNASYLGGLPAEGSLLVTPFDNGSIGVKRYVAGAWQDQIYGWNSKGSRLQAMNGATLNAYALTSPAGSFTLTGTAPTLVSNTAISPTQTRTIWTTEGLRITQDLTYQPNSAYYGLTWQIANETAGDLNDLRFFHGEDTYFFGGDQGAGYWDEPNNTIGVQKHVNEILQRMSLQAVTPPYTYESLHYLTVKNNVNAGALTNTIDPSESTDNGYALEWRRGTLLSGETWTITAFEKFADVAAGIVTVTAPTVTDCPVGGTCDLIYTVTNTYAAPKAVSLSLGLDQPSWSGSILSPTTPVTIPGLSSQQVTVRVSVPSGPYAVTTGHVTLQAAADATMASDTSSVRVIGATIAGRVTDQAGTGIGNIWISVNDANGIYLGYPPVFTQPDGTYTLSGLSAGSYKLLFNGNAAFASQWYNNKTTSLQADFVPATVGATTSGINAVLAPAGSIAGRVTNQAGTGIGYVWISVYGPSGNYLGISGTTTDLNGNYTLSGIPAGSYKLFFGGGSQDYVDQWYNGRVFSAQADLVTVTAGATTSGINAVLSPAGRISGRVTDTTGTGIGNVYINVTDTSGAPMGMEGAMTQPDGTYTVYGLPAGSYKINFYGGNAGPAGYVGQWYNNQVSPALAQLVTVSVSATTSGIDAVLSPGGSVAGRVTNQAGSGLGDVVVCVQDGGGNYLSCAPPTMPDGNYSVKGVPAGSWKVYFDGAGAGYGPQWYNGKLSAALADPVAVSVNAATAGINAVLATAVTVITSFTPDNGTVGTSVTIHGANFDPSPSGNTVKFGGVAAPVTGTSQNTLVVTVPAGATSGPISVTTSLGTATSSTSFAVITSVAVSGMVTDSASAPVAGAVIAMVGNPAISATSAADGSFSLAGLPMGTDFALGMSKSGYATTYTHNFNSTSNVVASAPYVLFTPAEVSSWGITTGMGTIRTRVVNGADPQTGYLLGAVVTATSLNTARTYPVVYYDGTGMGGGSTFANGVFTVLNVDDGDTVKLTVSKPGWSFNSRIFTTHAAGVSEGRVHGASVNPAEFPIATTTGREFALSAAFDGANYLVGIEGDAVAPNNITAQLVSPAGAPVGGRVSVGRTGGAPHVAFDGTNYLLVWNDDATAQDIIYGQLISKTGVLVNGPFAISAGPIAGKGQIGGVVFDGSNYLVLWCNGISQYPDASGKNWSYAVTGRLVSTTGALVSGEIVLGTADGTANIPALAFDGANYLAVWVQNYDPALLSSQGYSGTNVYGRFLDRSGTPVGGAFPIDADTTPSDNPLAVAFDGSRYLVVFSDANTSTTQWDWNLYGRLVGTTGTVDPTRITVSNAAGGQLLPMIVFDGTNYLVTWNDGFGSTATSTKGRFLAPAGNLTGPEFTLFAPTTSGSIPFLAGVNGFNAGKYLALANWGMPGANPGDFNAYSNADVYGEFVAKNSVFGTANISAAPAAVNFGTVQAGSSTAPQTITVTNNGPAGLTVYSGEMTGDYASFTLTPGGANPCPALPHTFASGESCTLLATFAPAGAGATAATFVITADAANMPVLSIPLQGTGAVSYPVTINQGPNGTISGPASYLFGSMPTYSIIPDANYHIVDVTVNGSSVGAVATYTLPAGTSGPVTIAATFAVDQFSITTSAGVNGTITPSQMVNFGANSAPVTVVPLTGYLIAGVTVDGSPQTISDPQSFSYTFTNVTTNHGVTASFAAAVYAVALNQGANGTISGPSSFSYGSMPLFTFIPSANYHVATVTVNGSSVGAVPIYTLPAGTVGPVTIAATFAIDQFSITTSAGTNGTISPSQNLDYGTNSTTVIVTPNTGHHIAGVAVDGSPQTIADPQSFSYAFTNVTSNHSVTASFAADSYAVTLNQGANGTISGPTGFSYGSMPLYTFAPDANYHVAAVTVNGSSVGAVTSYTLPAGTVGPVTIAATFAIDSYQVTFAAGPNGTLSGNASQTVDRGGSTTSVAVVPAPGYHFVNWTGTGGLVATANPLTVVNVTASLTITATFAADAFTITADAGEDGVITPAGAVVVAPGGSSTFTIRPTTGYYIADVLVDGVSVGGVSIYTFTNVSANHSIQVVYAVPDGRLDPNGTEVGIGDCVIAMRIALGDIEPTPDQKKRGDVAPLVNGKPVPDGVVDLGDAVVILRRVVGLSTW